MVPQPPDSKANCLKGLVQLGVTLQQMFLAHMSDVEAPCEPIVQWHVLKVWPQCHVLMWVGHGHSGNHTVEI